MQTGFDPPALHMARKIMAQPCRLCRKPMLIKVWIEQKGVCQPCLARQAELTAKGVIKR